MFARTRRCGVYILRFASGELYVGKAVDVTRRFAQHRVTYDDIDAIAFLRLPRKLLTPVEEQTVHVLERGGHRVRNVIFASMPVGDSDFDLVMPRQDQDAWVEGRPEVNLGGPRIVDLDLRRRFARRFDRLMEMGCANRVVALARRYAQTCLPAPVRSEVAFWSCSCLPAGFTPLVGELVYLRFNVNWQVTLTLSSMKGQLLASFHLARSVLEQAFGPDLDGVGQLAPHTIELDNLLIPGGQDQTNLYVVDSEIDRFLDNPAVLKAIRTFNLRLMRKGPCAYGRYHCLDLADRLLTGSEAAETGLPTTRAAGTRPAAGSRMSRSVPSAPARRPRRRHGPG